MAEWVDYYKYEPSMAAAVIFIVSFALSGLYHLYQIIRLKSWYFTAFFFGCIIETIGYAARAIGASEEKNYWSKGPYIIQALLLLIGPALFAASIYMVLGRLIRLLEADELSLIRPKCLTKFFLFGDIASLVAQGAGGAMLASADDKQKKDLGQIIIIVGLGIQIVFFGLFGVVTVLFHIGIRKNPTQASIKNTSPWQKLLVVLYGTSVLIMVRSVFRVIEYVMGEDEILMAKEVFIYVFDAALMLITSIAFNIFHPSRIITKEARGLVPSYDSENQLDSIDMDTRYTGRGG